MRREILIDNACGEVRVALLEDDQLAEIVIERPGRPAVSGNIYKGRVSNILPGMQSAFLDVGLDRDVFLYVQDLLHPDADPGETLDPDAADGESGTTRRPGSRTPIEDLLKLGQELLVQVVRDPIGQKGARATAQISLPGRFLVYLPQVAHVGVSRRIEDEEERERLRVRVSTLVRERALPGGFIVRTAAMGQSERVMEEDVAALAEEWSVIARLAGSRPAPALLRAEAGAVAKVLRDLFRDDVARVTVEDADLRRQALAAIAPGEPSLLARIHLHTGTRPLFEERGVPAQVDRALRPRVWLKSGGSIVINQTEALVAIDVNTGKYVGVRRLEETIAKTNLEAAAEIVRQVRLRDLGGIIVIDFIDMEEARSKEDLIRFLEQEIKKDRAKTRMLPLSEFGLVEITRQRARPSLERTLGAACPCCGGSGRVKSAETLYFELARALRAAGRVAGPVTVAAHPAIMEELRTFAAARLEGEGAVGLPRLEFRADVDLSLQEFRIDPDES